MKKAWYILLAILLIFSACSRTEPVKGVYVVLQNSEIRNRYGGEMGALADELKEAGVTHVIVPVLKDGTAYYPSDVLPQRWDYGTDLLAFRHALRRRNINFVARIPVFEDAYTYRSQPALRAVSDFGTRNSSEELSAICPCDPAYREYKLNAIEEVMLILQPDGIYLDKCSFPMEADGMCSDMQITHSRNYCFCNTCLTSFSSYAGIDLPTTGTAAETNAWILENYQNAWINWKTGVITSFMEKANKRIRDINPDCRIMLAVMPWKEQDHHAARRRLAGQDVKTLAPFADDLILKTDCNIPNEIFESTHASILAEIAPLATQVIPLLSLEIDPARSTEKDFQSNLQYFRNQVIVYDWSTLLKNRRYLNIFTTEPII